MVAALLVPAVLAGAGAAVEYSNQSRNLGNLRAAADAAALAAAREMVIADPQPQRVQAVAQAVADANLAREGTAGPTFTLTSEIIGRAEAIGVTISSRVDGYFSGMLGQTERVVQVRSVARLVGGSKVCVIGTETRSAGAVSLERNARMTGQDCAVYANSENPNGLIAKDGSRLTAGLVCSAGGANTTKGTVQPTALTDCPPVADPLLTRPQPSHANCTFTNKIEAASGLVPLLPGTYCGGVVLKGTARAAMAPGIYVFKDKPLTVTDNAELYGRYVGLHFADEATFRFDKNALIDLGAPKTGTMSGILFSQDRSEPEEDDEDEKNQFIIGADRARYLTGTIYLPRARLKVSSRQPVADQSPWTAIIARRLTLNDGPHLVLNTNYGGSDVPVPTGIDQTKTGAKIYLDR